MIPLSAGELRALIAYVGADAPELAAKLQAMLVRQLARERQNELGRRIDASHSR